MSWQAALVRWAIKRKLRAKDGGQSVFGLPMPPDPQSEAFVTDVQMSESVQKAKGKVSLVIWPKMHHTWPLHSVFVPEGRKALDHVVCFIDDAGSQEYESSFLLLFLFFLALFLGLAALIFVIALFIVL